MARTRGCRPWLSWVLAADIPTASGRPVWSDSTWILEPGLPRSTGLGPVSPPPFSPARWRCPAAPESSPPAPGRPVHRERHGAAAATAPAFVQAANRRCTVAFDTSNPGGRCRHAHPVRSTYTIAASTARGSTIAVPPPYGRARCGGINGCASAHSLSGTHARTNRSSTDVVIYHSSPPHHVSHALRACLNTGSLAGVVNEWVPDTLWELV